MTDESIVTAISGEKSQIVARGLLGAMHPGTVFQLGSENHMTVHQDGRRGASESKPSNFKNKYKITGENTLNTEEHGRRI